MDINCASAYNFDVVFNYFDTIMKKKPFNIEKAKSGARVITRDGRKARVVCYDAGGHKPILAYYEDRYGKHPEFYTEDGLVGEGCQSYHDLFLVDESIKKDEADSVEKEWNELQKYFKSINEAFEDGRKFERGFTHNPTLSDKEVICLKRTLDFLRKEHGRYGGEDFTNEIPVLEWMITHPTMVLSTHYPHWKPSEEQMEALFNNAQLGGLETRASLSSLYNDLKKL